MKIAVVFIFIAFLSPALANDPHQRNNAKAPASSQPRPYISGEYIALGNHLILEKITIAQDEVESFIQSNPNETLMVGGDCLGPCEQVPEGEIVPLTSQPRRQIENQPQSLSSATLTKNSASNPSDRNNWFDVTSREQNAETSAVDEKRPAIWQDSEKAQSLAGQVITKLRSWLRTQSSEAQPAKRKLASAFEPFSQPKSGLKLGTVSIAFPAAVAGSLLMLLLLSVATTLRRKRRTTSGNVASSKLAKTA